MAFKNEYRDIHEEMPEWQYLTDIGVRDMFGHPIHKSTLQLTVDRENNYFLIEQGQTSKAREGEEIYYFALCLDGIVLNLEAKRKSEGSCRNKDCIRFWSVFKIHYPESWDRSKYPDDKLIRLIKDGFTNCTYSKRVGEDCYKEIIVDITALDEKSEVM